MIDLSQQFPRMTGNWEPPLSYTGIYGSSLRNRSKEWNIQGPPFAVNPEHLKALSLKFCLYDIGKGDYCLLKRKKNNET